MNEVHNNSKQSAPTSLGWHNQNYGKLLIALSAMFLITTWFRFILAILLLPLIFLVYRKSRVAIILAAIYAILLTIVNSSVYVANNYDSEGVFNASPWPILIFFLILIGIITFAVKSYKDIGKKVN